MEQRNLCRLTSNPFPKKKVLDAKHRHRTPRGNCKKIESTCGTVNSMTRSGQQHQSSLSKECCSSALDYAFYVKIYCLFSFGNRNEKMYGMKTDISFLCTLGCKGLRLLRRNRTGKRWTKPQGYVCSLGFHGPNVLHGPCLALMVKSRCIR